MVHFTQENKNVYEITKQEFEKIKNKALIIDVREPGEFQMLQKIPNSINVPYRELIKKPEKYIPNKEVIVVTVCNAGNRSSIAAKSLREQGYNSYVLMLGIYGYYHK